MALDKGPRLAALLDSTDPETIAAAIRPAAQIAGIEWIDDHPDRAARTINQPEEEPPWITIDSPNDPDEYVLLITPTGGESRLRGAADYDDCTVAAIPSIGATATGTIETLAEKGVHIYAAEERLTLHPSGDGLTEAAQAAVGRLSGDRIDGQELLRGIPWGGGRPPLGTTSRSGELRPGDDYREVCRVLQAVEDDRLDKTTAANRLDCSRATIANALQRAELYQLDR